MQSPTRATRVTLALVVGAVIFLEYWAYSQQYYRDPGVYTDVLRGTASAPAQYRIGVVFAASFIASHAHIGLPPAMTILDAVSSAICVCLLYGLLRRSALYEAANNELRWFGSFAFIVLVQFYLLWLTWYQRPETLPTAALLACTLWFLTPNPRRAGRPVYLSMAALLALASAQALVRADVTVALNLGVVIACFVRRGNGFALPRLAQTATGLLCIAIGGGIQWFMMHVAYPYATYGSTPIFQFIRNFTSPARLIPFCAFLLPFGWTVRNIAGRKSPIESPLLAAFVGAFLFLAIWCVMGKIDEVRIFLPFALCLAPVTAQLAMERASSR